jgi:hypothetical protein
MIRALEALANDKLHRKHLRDRAAYDHPSEEMPLEQDRAHHGVQAGRGRTEELAPSRRPQPVAKNRRRVKFLAKPADPQAQTAAA